MSENRDIETASAQIVNVKHEIPILHNNKTLRTEVKICETLNRPAGGLLLGPENIFAPSFYLPE